MCQEATFKHHPACIVNKNSNSDQPIAHVTWWKRHLIRQRYDSHHTHVCSVTIEHVVIEIPERTAPMFGTFLQFAHFILGISRVPTKGKRRLCSSCHALIMHPKDLILPHSTPLICHPSNMKSFSLLRAAIRCGPSQLTLQRGGGQTDRQTDYA